MARHHVSSALKKWSASEIRMKIAELRSHLSADKSDLSICEEMSIDLNDFANLKNEMYRVEKIDLHGKSTDEVYVDYVLVQKGCIRDLNGAMEMFKATKQLNALVGAIRARSDIYDKIIQRGQEFGVLEKVPEKKMVIGGLLVAGLDNKELRAHIAKELNSLSEITKKYGDTDITGAPISMGAAAAAGVVVPAPLALPAPSSETIDAPAFSGKGRPKASIGGLSKAAGGKATAKKREMALPDSK